MADPTNIPAPRVPIMDERTGLMSREWYRFFTTLFNQVGVNGNTISIQDLELSASGLAADSLTETLKALQDLQLSILPQVTSTGGTTYSVFTSTTSGLAPASGGGTTNFLRADGTWAVPPGTGGVTFANPTGTVGPTAVNGVATTAMRSDAAPALNTSANFDVSGSWRFDGGYITVRQNLGGGSYWTEQIGWITGPEFAFQTFTAAGATYGFYLAGTRYLRITTSGVDVPTGTLSVASTSVRDGAILTSGTVNAARLPTFGTSAAGIVGASGGGTTNYLRADGTWAAPPGTGGVSFANPTASVGLTAVNGVSTNAMRADAAPALDVAIAPTWTGQHIFNGKVGTGAVTPTADLHLGAGTATANTAPLKFTSGTNLTTPEVGAVEYDGSLFYKTPTGTARALNHNSYFYRKNTATTLAITTGAQSWLDLADGVLLAANTIYYFEGEFKLITTNTASHTESHGFALTTATVTNIAYSVVRRINSTTASSVQANWFATNAASVVTTAITTAQDAHYRVQGTISIGTGGYVNPQISFNTAGPGGSSSIALGAWIVFTPIGATGSNVSIGTWS